MSETKEVYFEGNLVEIPVDHYYIARDKCGSVYSYETAPSLLNGSLWWTSGNNSGACGKYSLVNTPLIINKIDWDKSLMCYGEKEMSEVSSKVFKVGDKVKVVGFPDGNIVKPWVSGMEEEIGFVSKVWVVHSSGDIMLEDSMFSFPSDSLELVTEEPKIMFKIGDRVKVVKKVEYGEEGSKCYWVEEMDSYIGHEFVVDGIDKFGLELKDVLWTFPPASLSLVTTSNKQGKPKVSEAELKNDRDFNNLYEVYEHLSKGGIIIDITFLTQYRLYDKGIQTRSTKDSQWFYNDIVIEHYHRYRKAQKEPEWYEEDFKPCFCWVDDYSPIDKKSIDIIVAYNKDTYTHFKAMNEQEWTYAVPLTLAEVSQYCLECE